MKLPSLIGVLGDIHCETALLEGALELFRREGAEHLLSTGDVVDGPGELDRVIELLDGAKVDVVRGNHERWLLGGDMRDLPDATPLETLTAENRKWLSALPPTRAYTSAAGRVLLCHGVGEEDMTMFTEDDSGYSLASNDALHELLAADRCDIMIGGHTHRRMVRELEGVTFINAGTLSRGYSQGVVLIDFAKREVRGFDWQGTRFERGPAKTFGTRARRRG